MCTPCQRRLTLFTSRLAQVTTKLIRNFRVEKRKKLGYRALQRVDRRIDQRETELKVRNWKENYWLGHLEILKPGKSWKILEKS